MKNKKYLIIAFILISFLFLNKTNIIKNKKLKELEYNITYKEAFPDENLRRGVVLCIMRNKCGDVEYNSGSYEYDYYIKNLNGNNLFNLIGDYYETLFYASRYGDILTNEDILKKEQEKISKEDLEKIRVLIPQYKENVVTRLDGIEYLKNLKVISLVYLEQENLDFSNNKELEKIYIGSFMLKNFDHKIKKINIKENTKLKDIAITFKNDSEVIDLSNNTSLEILNIKNANVLLNTISPSIKRLIINLKNDKKIDLTNYKNLEYLDLSGSSYLETIDLTKLKELKYLNLNSTMLRDKTINLSENTKLEELYIENAKNDNSIKIDSLDLRHNLNLKTLYLNANLKELNIENNNNIEKIFIDNNHIINIKIPNNLHKSVEQNLKIKVKKDTPISLPISINNEKLYIEDKSYFTRENDKYTFNTLGTFNETIDKIVESTFKYNLNIKIEVMDKKEEFNPLIKQNFYPLINEEIKEVQIKKLITNLPNDIKKFEIIDQKPIKFTNKGIHNVKVRITLNDEDIKEFDIPIKVYEKEYVSLYGFEGKINTNNTNIDLIAPYHEEEIKNFNNKLPDIVSLEGTDITYERKRKVRDDVIYGADDVSFKLKETDDVINYEYSFLPQGLKADADLLYGKIKYEWKKDEFEHDFYINYKENGHIYKMDESIKITLIRDTDRDGIPDSEDEDIDGDGFSNIEELKRGSDLYDKFSTPLNVVEDLTTEASRFKPIIDQKDYKPLYDDNISREKIKKIITNLPTNIKNFEIVKTFVKGSNSNIKIGKVKITFSDNSVKEFILPIKVYIEDYIFPEITIDNEEIEVIENKNVNVSIKREYVDEFIDEEYSIKYKKSKIDSYKYTDLPNGLTGNLNGISGVIDYNFTGDEEEHIFYVTYNEKGDNYDNNKYVEIKLLRDTDKDGTPDKDDDDKDGDGFSNAVEIARGSDPYDKFSIPDMPKKQEVDNLVKELRKIIKNINENTFDTKNKLDVDNLKNNFLPSKKQNLNDISSSYDDNTSDADLDIIKSNIKEEIKSIKEELNKLKNKANFKELDKEINNPIEDDIYTKDSKEEIKEKILEAKNLSRDSSTQEEVDEILETLKNMKNNLALNIDKLKLKIEEIEKSCSTEECKNTIESFKKLVNKPDQINKKIYLNMLEIMKDLVNEENLPNNPITGIKNYSLIILTLIIFINLVVFFKLKFIKNKVN